MRVASSVATETEIDPVKSYTVEHNDVITEWYDCQLAATQVSSGEWHV